MANSDLNTDQDINNTTTDRPDEYATRYGGSNPDLDVAGNTAQPIPGGSADRLGNGDGDPTGSTGNIGATPNGTYNVPNDRTGPSNTSAGGGFDDNSDANMDTPVMGRGGGLGSTDVMSNDPGTGASADQGREPRTDTTLDEGYSTGPRTTDPEQELLNPGYDPRADRDEMGPNRADDRVSPGLPGLPDQRGTLDQTTYSSDGNDLGTDAGTRGGAGLP